VGHYGNPTRTHAEEGQIKRSGKAERSREEVSGVSPGYDTTQHARTHIKTPRRGSAVRWGGGGGVRGSPPTATIQLARAPKKTKSSAATRPSGSDKGGSGIFPDYATTQYAHAQMKAKCSGRAERSGEGGSKILPTTTIKIALWPKKAKSSAAARPSAAETGGSGVSPDYGNPTRTQAEEVQIT
jgi:hypothetical protein